MFSDITQSFKERPFFIFLLPVLFIHIGYNELFGFLSAEIILKNLTGVALGILTIYIISKLYFKHKSKAIIFSFVLSLYILIFGYIHDTLKSSFLADYLSKYTVLIPYSLLIFIFYGFWLKKKTQTNANAYRYLNILMTILMILECIKSIYAYDRLKINHNLIDARFSVYNEFKKRGGATDALKPDIYLIIFDEMPSASGLIKYFGKDNASLDDSLIQKGFYVVKKSKTNYNKTVFSMSSIFNMMYLPNTKNLIEDPLTILSGIESLTNNSLFSILKSEEYIIHSYQPLSFKSVQSDCIPFFLFLKKFHYLYKTLPGRMYKDLSWHLYRTDIAFLNKKILSQSSTSKIIRRNELLHTTELIKKSCVIQDKPKFIYGHYILPHSPYTFDRSGKILQPAPNDPFDKKVNNKKAFYEQVLYTNAIINDLISYIKNHNKKNTIIILMGDHGYRDESGYITKGSSFENLNAIYFPDRDYKTLHDSISAVNVFRIVLNKVFNTNIQSLKDSTFLIRSNFVTD